MFHDRLGMLNLQNIDYLFIQSQTNQKNKIPNGIEKMSRDFLSVSFNTGPRNLKLITKRQVQKNQVILLYSTPT